MHEPGSKTTTTTRGGTPGGGGPPQGGPASKYHGSNSSLHHLQYYTPYPRGHTPPRHRVLAGGAILQPSGNEVNSDVTHLPAGPHSHATPTYATPTFAHQFQVAQQQQACKKNLQKMMGISPSDIDKYSRIFFPVTFTCFNLMYWIIYLHVSDEVAEDLVMLNG